MPRFLNTWTGEFEWHNNPEEVRYAILSHVWRAPERGGEQTFDDVRRIQAAVKAKRKEPDTPGRQVLVGTFGPPCHSRISEIFSDASPLSSKIKGLCEVAREAGFRLVWNDACCIDKSSSAELSGAINSMYEWYRLSDLCYVYLSDVPDGDIPEAEDSSFRWSRWHRRGWTLQELIAPERVEFLTRTWRFLGTKLGLVQTLARITTIDVDILTGRAPVNSASVAQRMSWAAQRMTTRVEDEAYCLMGLFGVHMPPIYGEGRNAFLRLQEEIIRTIPDQSVFAWGRQGDVLSLGHDDIYGDSGQPPSLLAPSPRNFAFATTRPVAPSEFASRLGLATAKDVPPLHCVFTPQGVRMQLLCIDLARIPGVIKAIVGYVEPYACEDCMRRGEPDRLALLQCEDTQGRLAALPLHPPSTAVGGGRGSPIGTFIRIHPCSCLWLDGAHHTVPLSRETLSDILAHVAPAPAEVSILRHYSEAPTSKSLQWNNSPPPLKLWPANRPDGVAFALAPRSVAGLSVLGFTVAPSQVARSEGQIILETTLTLRDRDAPQSLQGEWLQSIRVRLSLTFRERDIVFRFSITNCLAELLETSPLPRTGSTTAPPAYETTVTRKEVPFIGARESVQEVHRRDAENHLFTLASSDFLVPSYPERLNRVQLLRLSLQRPPDGLPTSAAYDSRTLWLVMEMSQAYEHVPETKSALRDSGDATMDLGADNTPVSPCAAILGTQKRADMSSADSSPSAETPTALPEYLADLSSHSASSTAVSTSYGLGPPNASGIAPDTPESTRHTSIRYASRVTGGEVPALAGPPRPPNEKHNGEARPPCTRLDAPHLKPPDDSHTAHLDAGQGMPAVVRLPSSPSPGMRGEPVSKDAEDGTIGDTSLYKRSIASDALRRENDELRAQMSAMASQLADLTSTQADMASQLKDLASANGLATSRSAVLSSQVLARLDSDVLNEKPLAGIGTASEDRRRKGVSLRGVGSKRPCVVM